jgi:hypothetical protein
VHDRLGHQPPRQRCPWHLAVADPVHQRPRSPGDRGGDQDEEGDEDGKHQVLGELGDRLGDAVRHAGEHRAAQDHAHREAGAAGRLPCSLHG